MTYLQITPALRAAVGESLGDAARYVRAHPVLITLCAAIAALGVCLMAIFWTPAEPPAAQSGPASVATAAAEHPADRKITV